MADHLDNDELAHIRQIFGKYDINGDGNITFEVLITNSGTCRSNEIIRITTHTRGNYTYYKRI
jgi:Ca2+-binding EF-hand superfamily protein